MNYKLLTFLILLIPFFAEAQELQLTNIPFVSEAGGGVSGVVEGLFYLAIVVAGMFAVVKLVIAGAKYMMSDVVTTKQSALGDIKGAIIGLLLILGTVLILDTINDDITNANLAIDDIEFSFDGDDGGGGDPCDGIEDCEIQTCPFLRWELQCSDWCDNQGGTFIDGGWFSSHQCAVSGQDPVTRNTNAVLAATDSTIEDYDEGDSLEICRTQGGPIACQSTEEDCSSGRMSTDGESGSPTVTNIEGVGRVVVCNF